MRCALEANVIELDPKYESAMKLALIEQAISVLFAALLLDNGAALMLAVIAMIAFWTASLTLIARHPQTAIKFDLSFLKFGYLGLLILCFILAPWLDS